MIDSILYQKFKPLRNYLRLLNIKNALYVIWAYINFFQFNKDLPPDIETHNIVTSNRNTPQQGLFEWELSLLAREVISHSVHKPKKNTKDLRIWTNLSNAINKLKDFENNAWPEYGDAVNIHDEIRRVLHRQIPWHSHPNLTYLLRYYMIYSHPNLEEIVNRRLGLRIDKWYSIGFILFSLFLHHHSAIKTIDMQAYGISNSEYDAFIKFVSINIDDLKILIEKEVRYDDEFVYTFNPIEYYPLILIDDNHFCPVINFLVWRITSGIYFDLIGDNSFGYPFGIAFQSFLIKVANVILADTDIEVIPEQKYQVGKNKKDSIDLIISEASSALFVEFKAKRLQARSKSQLLSNDAIERDIGILADDVVQGYKTIADYSDGRYPHFKANDKIEIFPFVVTLEEWFLLGDGILQLEEAVRERLEKDNLPVSCLEQMPFTICSSETFEYLVQVISKHSILEVMRNWHKPEFKGHDFGQHIRGAYRGEYKQITEFFSDEAKMITNI